MARSAIGHYNTLNKNRSPEELSVYEEFGRRLASRMQQLGWGQSELARRATDHLPKPAEGQVQGLKIGRDLISNYIRGKYLPRPPTLDAIAKALHCLPEDLLPADAVPSVVSDAPRADIREVEGGRMSVRINRVVSKKTAIDIMSLLMAEDPLPPYKKKGR